MAKKGLNYPVCAKYNASGSTVTYTNGAALGNGISVRINFTRNNEKVYGNDKVVLTDTTINGGTAVLNMTHLTDAIKVALLKYTEGAEVDAVTHAKELIASESTEPEYVGFGVYGYGKDDSGVGYWKAIWIKKVQFTYDADEYDTKTPNATFKTPTLNGEIMMAADGKWTEEGTFSTEAGAIAWLNVKSGISTDVSTGLTELSISNTTLTPAFSAAIFNYSGDATDNVAIAATAAGVIKLFVDGVYNQTLVTTVAGTAVTMGAGNNKLFQIVIQESGKSPVTTTIMMQRAAG